MKLLGGLMVVIGCIVQAIYGYQALVLINAPDRLFMMFWATLFFVWVGMIIGAVGDK